MPVEIIMPKFGFTLETSEIVNWLKQEGDTVESGEPVCEVTTDKVNMEVEAPENGTLYKILYDAGSTVEVPSVIAYMLRPGEVAPDLLPDAAPAVSTSEPAAREAAPAAAPASTPSADVPASPIARRVAEDSAVDLSSIQGTGPKQRIMRRDVEQALQTPSSGKPAASPAARRMAAEAGLDLKQIAGSGPGGRVQGWDVADYLAASSAQPAAAPAPISHDGDRQIIRLEGMRRTIANRLQQSFQTAPHIFVEVEVDMGGIEAMRARLKNRDQKLSVTSVLVKACAAVLKDHPAVNATLENDEISMWSAANIGVAVALDDGLIVPVIQDAGSLSLREIQSTIGDLTQRARNNALRLDDVSGGTFTISNMGMMGVSRFTAIINPPQVAILAVGRTAQQFVPDENGQPVLR